MRRDRNAQRLLAVRPNRGALVVPGNESSELVQRLTGNGFPQMPAGGLSPEQLAEVTSWIADGAHAPP